jgi:hypothetical protein
VAGGVAPRTARTRAATCARSPRTRPTLGSGARWTCGSSGCCGNTPCCGRAGCRVTQLC